MRQDGNAGAGPVECAGAVIRDTAGRLLLIRRGNEPGRGLWSLPGGRVEPDEDRAAAAAREVAEETGLRIDVGDLLERVVLDGGAFAVSNFHATVAGGTLSAGDDAMDVGWFTPDEVRALEMSPGLLARLEALGMLG